MPVDLDPPEALANHPRAIDHEGGPLHTHGFLTVQVLLLPDPIVFTDLVVGVSDQSEWKLVLSRELFVRLRRVGADPDDSGTGLLVGIAGIAKGAGFLGT